MGVGYKLKEILKKKGITVAALSRETEIPQQTLYSIINRDSGLSFENVLIIAQFLDIDYFELLDKNDSRYGTLIRERNMDDMDRYGLLPERTFEESVDYMYDVRTKDRAWYLTNLMDDYTIECKKGVFYLSNGKNSIIIGRDDIEFVYEKASIYVKNLLDSITNNKLSKDKLETNE